MTESPQKHKEEEIFAAARVMNSPEKRIAYLDKVCSDNTTMRNEIEELLTIYDRDQSFLESPPADWNRTASTLSSPVEAPGTMIGPYKILEVIGEGGMGNVYMAEQTEPVHRKVALKIIKSGMDSKSVIARFEAERQALALMDHPNIARFYDAGIAESGSPFFAMELIKGRPIIEFCRQHNLNLKAKLELFQQVCLGVQHAHQKGIIHRDLKPSNVLVARYDDRPVAKVIDFGVAKAVGEKLTDKTMFTRFGQLVGTLEYMSPEQSQFNQLDIDTRSDVYSLGAILYELLTGEPPFEREKLSSAALEEALRIIREDEPTKPSTRLSTLHEADSVENPQSNGKPFRRDALIPADLDWIVMKCLEKDRSRRYATTNNFTEDLQRFLNNEPIVARPPSTIYRLKKFAKRKRGMIASFSLVSLTLLVSVVVGSILVWNKQKELITQRDVAQENLIEADKQKKEAERQRNRATKALKETRATIDKYVETVQNSELLKEERFKPLMKILLKEALAHYQQFVREHDQDENSLESVAEAFTKIGDLTDEIGNPQGAIEAFQESVDLYRRLAQIYPSRQEYQIRIAFAESVIARRFQNISQNVKATEFIKHSESSLKNIDENTSNIDILYFMSRTYSNLGNVLRVSGNSKKADRLFQRALAFLQQLHKSNPNSERYSNDLAQVYLDLSNGNYWDSDTKQILKYVLESQKIWKQLEKEYPQKEIYRFRIAKTHISHAVVLTQKSLYQEAENQDLIAQTILKNLVQKHPTVTKYWDQLLITYRHIGNRCLNYTQETSKGVKAYEETKREFSNCHIWLVGVV